MAKWAHDDIMDAALDYIIDNSDYLYLCTSDTETAGTPDYTKVTTTANLISGHAVTSGDFAIDDGDTSGRKVTVAEQANLSVTVSGDAVNVCLVDSGNTKVLYQTTCTTQSLSSGSQVTIPAWDIEFRDPV